MATKRVLAIALVVLAVLVIVAGRWLFSEETPEQAATPVVPRTIDDTRLPALGPAGEAPPAPPATADTPLPPLPESTVDAAESMAHAMKHGDPQAPAVVRDTAVEKATPAEIADPEAYQRFEARQNQRLYRQYVEAADKEIPRLQADIERARKAGLPPEQIAEGEEKLRRIQAMRDQLQAEHPDAFAPPR